MPYKVKYRMLMYNLRELQFQNALQSEVPYVDVQSERIAISKCLEVKYRMLMYNLRELQFQNALQSEVPYVDVQSERIAISKCLTK